VNPRTTNRQIEQATALQRSRGATQIIRGAVRRRGAWFIVCGATALFEPTAACSESSTSKPSAELAVQMNASAAAQGPVTGYQADAVPTADLFANVGGSADAALPVVAASGGDAAAPAAVPMASADADAPPANDAPPASAQQPQSTAPAQSAIATPQPPPEWPADCEETHLFRAHEFTGKDDTTAFVLAPGDERIMEFYFHSPWTITPKQMLQTHERVDNRQVVHHWMLYTIDGNAMQDGEVIDASNDFSSTSNPTEAQYLVGGVPGTSDITLPGSVGVRLPASIPAYLLQIHYFNATSMVQTDQTGVEICVTADPRPNEAAAHWLGKMTLTLPPHANSEVVSTCRPLMMTSPTHIMYVTPHMHTKGVHSKAVINRAGGEQVTFLDEPFEFREQRLYRMPKDGSAPDLLLDPGDTISTTCDWVNDTDFPLVYGQSTTNEMCFLTVWAWPAGSITNGSSLATMIAVPDDQGCLEP
jgi:hypothetical protein